MHKYLVEFLGTMFLMYVVLATKSWSAIGLALGLAVLIGGPTSGGVYNPAVALAIYVAGIRNEKTNQLIIDKNEFIPYIVFEGLGALAAWYAYSNYVIAPN